MYELEVLLNSDKEIIIEWVVVKKENVRIRKTDNLFVKHKSYGNAMTSSLFLHYIIGLIYHSKFKNMIKAEQVMFNYIEEQ